jgi:NADPH-dependent glutamate synthase beta subunit-like oxidoreductase
MVDVPSSGPNHIQRGLEFLFQLNGQNRKVKVAAIGGGYTSLDCRRTAIGLGAESVKVYYRRTKPELLILLAERRQLLNE